MRCPLALERLSTCPAPPVLHPTKPSPRARRYFPIAPSYSGETVSYVLSDSLQEGYYEVSSVVSTMTAYPLLTSLAGLTQITQEDAAGSAVKGLWEAAARQVSFRVSGV